MPDGFPLDQRAIYEISASYPQMHKYYGWLAGLAYTVPYSIAGLVMGSFSGGVNRKNFMSLAIIISGVC